MSLFDTGKPLPKLVEDLGTRKVSRPNNKRGYVTEHWVLVECWCSNQWEIREGALKFMRVKECWLHKGIRHGGLDTPEYQSWKAMKSRCYYPKNIRYDRYGGRGITVCERWRSSFANFREDMGKRPEGTTLDRIDSDGNYEPNNCRWATYMTQTYNQDRSRRVKIWVMLGGEKLSIWQVASRLDIKPGTAYLWHRKGLLEERTGVKYV